MQELSNHTATPRNPYSQLKANVEADGLLKRAYFFYGALIAFTLAGYIGSTFAIVYFEQLLPLAFACLSFTFFSVQVAGLMHDSGHRAVFASPKMNNMLGHACCALLVMVFNSWRERHNAHHAHPNQEGIDPDLRIPLIATSVETYLRKGSIERALMRYQAYYYYPLGALVGISNRLGSVTYFFRHPLCRTTWQLPLYLAGLAFLFIMPFILFAPEKALFVLALVHLSSGTYMASCFAPNHKGMLELARDDARDFLEQQIITSRNIRGGFFTELLMVGLNHQIEHHLFPTCPRNKLHRLKPHVREMCGQLDLAYSEVGMVETNKVVFTALLAVSRRTAQGLGGLKARTSFLVRPRNTIKQKC